MADLPIEQLLNTPLVDPEPVNLFEAGFRANY